MENIGNEDLVNNSKFSLIKNPFMNEYLQVNPSKLKEVIQCSNCKLIDYTLKLCSNCQCSFCLDCIDKFNLNSHSNCNDVTFSEIDGFSKNLLNHITVTCSYCLNNQHNNQFPINYTFTLFEYPFHFENCLNRNFQCKFCEINGNLNFITEHILNCDKEKIICLHCKTEIFKINLNNHLNECSSRITICDYCETSVLIKSLEEHSRKECRNLMKNKITEKDEIINRINSQYASFVEASNYSKNNKFSSNLGKIDNNSNNMNYNYSNYNKEQFLQNNDCIKNFSNNNMNETIILESIQYANINSIDNNVEENSIIPNSFQLFNNNETIKMNEVYDNLNNLQDFDHPLILKIDVIDSFKSTMQECYSSNTLQALSDINSSDGISFNSSGYSMIVLKEKTILDSITFRYMLKLKHEFGHSNFIKENINYIIVASINLINECENYVEEFPININYLTSENTTFKVNSNEPITKVLIKINTKSRSNGFGLEYFNIIPLQNNKFDNVNEIQSNSKRIEESQISDSPSYFTLIEFINYEKKDTIKISPNYLNLFSEVNNEPLIINCNEVIFKLTTKIQIDSININFVGKSKIGVYCKSSSNTDWTEIGSVNVSSSPQILLYRLISNTSKYLKIISEGVFDIYHVKFENNFPKEYLKSINPDLDSFATNLAINEDLLFSMCNEEIEVIESSLNNSYILLEFNEIISDKQNINITSYSGNYKKYFENTIIYYSLDGKIWSLLFDFAFGFEFFEDGVFTHSLEGPIKFKYLKLESEGFIKIKNISFS